MNLREMARKILSESLLPLSARQIWNTAVKQGLDKQVQSHGKTPHATMGAFLYTESRKPNSGIIAIGNKPKLFQLKPSKSASPANLLPPQPAKKASVPTTSRFIPPCLAILRAHAPAPMGVAVILKEVLAANPTLAWQHSHGAIRAALLRAAKVGTEIRQVPGSCPPLFFIGDEIPATPPAKHYSFLECAEKVLREFGARRPMHYKDITNKALEQGWLVTDSENPASTMNSLIGTDIRKRLLARRPQLFTQHGGGYIGLAEWLATGLRFEAEQHNRKVCNTLLKTLHKMQPAKFEVLIRELLDEMDFIDTEVTRISGDGGIDVRGTWRIADGIQIKMAIQVKRWKANVQAPVVHAVRGSLSSSERGMIITTSDFSAGAKKEAEDPTKASTISLVNGEQLVKLLVKHGIGVTRDQIEILELDTDSDLFSPDK